MAVTLYVVLWCPVMLYYLRDVKDAYGLRRDLKVGMSYGLPSYLLYTCFRRYDFLQSLRLEVPSFLFLLFSMASLHSSTVTAPLVRTYFWVPEELGPDDEEERRRQRSPHDLVINSPSFSHPIVIPHRPIPLEQVLNNPGLAALFEAYSKSAFVWDSVLFHREVQTFRRIVSESPNRLYMESQRIYEQYIEPGSPCEMNLSFAVVQRINSAVDEGKLWPGMFDEAQAEIIRLVGNCTYRNFLYKLDATTKAQYMIPMGHHIPCPVAIDMKERCTDCNVDRDMDRDMDCGMDRDGDSFILSQSALLEVW
jgi:hypothetical protein